MLSREYSMLGAMSRGCKRVCSSRGCVFAVWHRTHRELLECHRIELTSMMRIRSNRAKPLPVCINRALTVGIADCGGRVAACVRSNSTIASRLSTAFALVVFWLLMKSCIILVFDLLVSFANSSCLTAKYVVFSACVIWEKGRTKFLVVGSCVPEKSS